MDVTNIATATVVTSARGCGAAYTISIYHRLFPTAAIQKETISKLHGLGNGKGIKLKARNSPLPAPKLCMPSCNLSPAHGRISYTVDDTSYSH